MKLKSLLFLLFLNTLSANGFVAIAQEYRVMTYNVHHCNPPAKKGVITTDSIASVIQKSGADIVLLQEVDYKSNRVQGEAQVAFIDSLLGKKERLIFGGDLNASPETTEIKYLLDRYTSTSEIFQHTFPNINPDVCIDYIFTRKSKSTKILSNKVLENIPHSDHLPVLAEIRL